MRITHWSGALALSLAAAVPLHAQDAPSARPITLVVPFAAGGGVDTVARVLAQRLGDKLHQNFVVENRPGGGGMIGIDYVARAAPDGHTILLMDIAAVLLKWLNKSVPFDVTKDFTPIAKVATADLVLFSNPRLPVKDVRELIAYTHVNPGKLLVGIPGVGTPHHLAATMFNTEAKLNITTVPYRGAAPALNDLVGGQIPTMWATPVAVLPFVKLGKVNALGVASAKRDPQLPDVATFAEAGLPGVNVDVWFGVAAPKATPADFVKRMDNAIRAIAAEPDLKARMTKLGFNLNYEDSGAFGKLIVRDHLKYGKVIRDAGITPK